MHHACFPVRMKKPFGFHVSLNPVGNQHLSCERIPAFSWVEIIPPPSFYAERSLGAPAILFLSIYIERLHSHVIYICQK